MSSSPEYIDPRGPRFGAVLTAAALVAVILTGSGWLLAAQAVVFAIGAIAGLKYAPYGYLYRYLVRPRLAPPAELEHANPPRFAQACGAGMAAIGALGYLAGIPALGVAFAGLALAAAFLNAAFELCLGCEVYLLFRRTVPRRRPAATQG